MFQNNAYMTKNFEAMITGKLRGIIVDKIIFLNDDADYEIDYLQIFEMEKDFHNGLPIQKITHHQEEPAHSETFFLLQDEWEILNTKVYVIDETEHHTFMLASDY